MVNLCLSLPLYLIPFTAPACRCEYSGSGQHKARLCSEPGLHLSASISLAGVHLWRQDSVAGLQDWPFHKGGENIRQSFKNCSVKLTCMLTGTYIAILHKKCLKGNLSPCPFRNVMLSFALFSSLLCLPVRALGNAQYCLRRFGVRFANVTTVLLTVLLSGVEALPEYLQCKDLLAFALILFSGSVLASSS